MRGERFIVLATATIASFAAAQESSSFPGPWTRNIQAPNFSRIVRCTKAIYTEGNIPPLEHEGDPTILLGQGALVTFECPQNVGGRLFFNVDEESTSANQSIGIGFSESSTSIGRRTDASTPYANYDLTQFLPLTRGGYNHLESDHVRGAFKYVTFFMPTSGDPKNGQATPSVPEVKLRSGSSQVPIGYVEDNTEESSIGISDVGVVFTAAAGMKDPRAYTGFFNSSDELLNRIWYAGAYTLQLTSIPSNQGGPPMNIDCGVNKQLCIPKQWSNDYTISNSSSVVVEGASKYRTVHSRNMMATIPGIAYSTNNMVIIKNTLESLFSTYPCDTYCQLETMLGIYQYILYSADFEFLESIWSQYTDMMSRILNRVNPDSGFLNAISSNTTDFERVGETIISQSMFSKVLSCSISLANWFNDQSPSSGALVRATAWRHALISLRSSLERPSSYNTRGLFFNTFTKAASQEPSLTALGNAWALYSKIVPVATIEKAFNLMETTSSQSIITTSVQLHAYAAVSKVKHAVDLIRNKWGPMLTSPSSTGSTLGNRFFYSAVDNHQISHAHSSSTMPTSFLMEHVLGLQLLEPAGRRWRIAPNLARLTSAVGGFETKLGRFIVGLSKTGDEETLEVIVPMGTQGFVIWEEQGEGDKGGVHLREGGKWRWKRIKGGRIEGGKVEQGGKHVSQEEWRKMKEHEEKKRNMGGHDEL